MPDFGKLKGWHNSYVAKILSNRAVLGEHQPGRVLANKKREPIGNALQDYYPRIIDDELFYRAQQARSERRVNGRGRKGKYLTKFVFRHRKVRLL